MIYFTSFDLFEVLSAATFGRSRAEDEVLLQHSAIFDCDLLIIDDLGTEMTNTFVSSQLFLCINERLMNKKSTIISTNLSLEALRDLYSERVFSRISSNFKMRKLIGKDIRLMKKLGEQGWKWLDFALLYDKVGMYRTVWVQSTEQSADIIVGGFCPNVFKCSKYA